MGDETPGPKRITPEELTDLTEAFGGIGPAVAPLLAPTPRYSVSKHGIAR